MEDSFVHSATVASNEKEMVKKERGKAKRKNPAIVSQGKTSGESSQRLLHTRMPLRLPDSISPVMTWRQRLASKYALKDSFGNLYEKTPDDMHRRLAARDTTV
jgi:hypothetical protein